MFVDGLEINNWNRSTVKEVKSGGIDVVHATCGVWEDLAGAITKIGDWRHFARENSDLVRIVGNVEEMRTAKDEGILGVILGFQNSSMLGDDPEMAGIFADLGIRIIQLTYNISNHLGSSCWEPEDGGLTRVGHRMISAFNSSGMLVDISHVGNRTGLEAIESSEKPIAVTHGNPSSFCDSPRNKPDYLIEALAARGGIIGCTLYPRFIGGSTITRLDWCQMVADAAEKIGVNHVAIGSDSVVGWAPDALGWMRNGRWDRPKEIEDIPAFPTWPEWFRGPEDFESLSEGFSEVGFTSEEIGSIMGSNWIRLFKDVFND